MNKYQIEEPYTIDVEVGFNYDLDKMKLAVYTKATEMPHFDTFEEWLNSSKED